MDYEQRKRYLVNAAYTVCVIALIIFVFRYAIFWLMPFVIAFSVAFVTKPIINAITRTLHLKRRPVAALVVALFYGTVGVLVVFASVQLVAGLRSWIFDMPQLYETEVIPALRSIYEDMMAMVSDWDPHTVGEIQKMAQNLMSELTNLVSTISSLLVSFISQMAMKIPSMFISTLFAVIGSFFIAMDYYRITNFIVGQFSEKNQGIIMDAKNYVVSSLFKILTSYAAIMFITFSELTVGFWFIGIKNHILLAACIALMDVMPVLGTGGVMIPWVLVEVIMKNYSMAVGLLCIYVFVTVVRNVIEPKIVGNRVGLHPILMLISMFIGGTVLGPLGIVIMPFLMIVVKNLNDTGKIHVYKNYKEPRPSWEEKTQRFEEAAEEALSEVYRQDGCNDYLMRREYMRRKIMQEASEYNKEN
ncbi:MAG: sporulation integral membrane protein YtvI [Firmicutes bacterium]|nr:sporulation integral membrane protein YtvI [Bacillota bacterium]